MTQWTGDFNFIGYLPQIFRNEDERSAQEQANERYAHGGGWNSFEGFTLDTVLQSTGLHTYAIEYAGDPPTREVARAHFHDQLLVLFEHAWVGIINPETNELIDIARMD